MRSAIARAGNLADRRLIVSLTHGAFWSAVAAAGARGLAFAAAAIVARRLGREEFGRLAMVQTTIDTFTVFSGFGLGLMSIRSAAQHKTSDPARVGRVLAVSSLVAAVTGGVAASLAVAFADVLATRFLGDPALAEPLRVGSISMFFAAMNGSQNGTLVGFGNFRALAGANSVAGALTFVFTLVGLSTGTLTGVLWGMAAGWFSTWCVFALRVRRQLRECGIRMSLRGATAELRMLWTFSLPSAIGDALVTPAHWWTRSLLARGPSGFAELGLFNAAQQVTLLAAQAAGVLGAPLLPILAARAKTRADTATHGIRNLNMLFFWAIGSALVLPLLAYPESLGLLFGARFEGDDSRRLVVLVGLVALVTTFKRGLANALVADGRMWWSVVSNGSWAVVLVSGAMLLRHKGAVGLAAALLAAYVLNVIVFLPVYLRTGFVPRRSIISWEAGAAWVATLVLAIGAYNGMALIYRIPLAVACIGIVIVAIGKLLLSRTSRDIATEEGRVHVP